MTRPDWDEYFMNMTELVAKRATCTRKKLGAVLVRDRRVIATGYNGSPPSQPHCDEIGCFVVPTTQKVDGKEVTKDHCIRTLHAELNAIMQCALHGVSTKGSTLYVMYNPCYYCTKALMAAGIKRVVYRDEYFHDDGLDHKAVEMMKETGIHVEKFGDASA
jgi:dCMP deaminase